MAKRLGFRSDWIAKRGREEIDLLPRDRQAFPRDLCTGWKFHNNITRDDCLGQIGSGWLEKTETERQHLFSDIAETIGTDLSQSTLKSRAEKPQGVD
ncbi:hypothetical protein N7539_008699 [Penicillium diatomitis]|uniref:Uncharacterized protein n=1 Tax=Penicillium diatomitis TaxID=2819901 RepID=A0A9X0BLW8_9EURO|nr:uncharacterized protein N7539_008613 [Penicillium diatomitis]XP_056786676.1 uncharacterized protein N7539_008699 [Penicillium diatomitis]KAJ5472044.1 hypothetical protein N7539_008613 [Penicillium diatomitis]KAJ5472130.1 hypothetical protein N7539_008699 [Penicillium diatomitis]